MPGLSGYLSDTAGSGVEQFSAQPGPGNGNMHALEEKSY